MDRKLLINSATYCIKRRERVFRWQSTVNDNDLQLIMIAFKIKIKEEFWTKWESRKNWICSSNIELSLPVNISSNGWCLNTVVGFNSLLKIQDNNMKKKDTKMVLIKTNVELTTWVDIVDLKCMWWAKEILMDQKIASSWPHLR